jgi:hypothetical protein
MFKTPNVSQQPQWFSSQYRTQALTGLTAQADQAFLSSKMASSCHISGEHPPFFMVNSTIFLQFCQEKIRSFPMFSGCLGISS